MRPENPSLDLEKFAELDQKQKLTHLIKFALLAPSSHNTQPWLFRLVGEHEIEVLANKERLLAVSDPIGREAYVSIGAAIENLIVAAEYFGFETELHFNGDTHNLLAASIKFQHHPERAGHQKDTAEAILSRHNNRNPFETRMPEQSFMDWALGLSNSDITVSIATEEPQKKEIVRIVGEALETALDDHNFRQELSHWMKSSLQKHQDGMPGYNLGMPALVSFILPAVMRKIKMGKTQRKMEEKNLKATPAFAVISSIADSKEHWMKCGMTLEKIALEADRRGIKIGVMAAAIEMKDSHKELQRVLGINRRPQVFFRLGYASKIPKASPRISEEQLMVS